MCESSAFMITSEGETKIIDYVVDIVPNNDGSLTLSNLLGGTKIV
ncbi:CooT family nickel-binding protein [Acetobacterium wieringae]|nr:CooT family nickel-binding protein [Acetobacterium wieringae]